MSSIDSKLTRREALLRRAKALEDLAEVYADLATEHDIAFPVTAVPTESKDQKEESLDDKLVRLPLGDACIEYLDTCKTDQKAKEIWAALEKAGRTAEAADPVKSVTWALKKLVGNGHEDLFSLGFGQWHLKSKYSTKRLNKMLKSITGRGGRDSEVHVGLTKAGIEKARSKGKQIGAPMKMDAEKVGRFVELRNGGSTIKDACLAIGISTQTYRKYRDQIAIWQEGDPWPLPEERLKELGGSHVRLVAT